MKRIGVLTLLLLLTVATLVSSRWDVGLLARQFMGWVKESGSIGVLAFVIFYSVATVLLVPGALITMGTGAMFGIARGFGMVLCAATVAAVVAFLISRYLARDLIIRKIGADPRFVALDSALAAEGWKIVLLTRLSPAFPFSFLNYAFGLTRIPLWQFAVTSCIGMIPGSFLYIYLGTLAAGTGVTQRTWVQWAGYLGGLIATIAVVWFVTRLARRAMKARMPEGPEQRAQ